MNSQKSTPSSRPAARKPQRRRGHERVAALLQAAAGVFAEKGYEAATMTAIAERAGAPIGSLYQFFPSKESLADALLERYGEQVEAGLRAVEAKAPELSTDALADALLDVLVDLAEERRTAVTLYEVRGRATPKTANFRKMMREGVARVLAAREAAHGGRALSAVAVVLAQSIKTLANLQTELPPSEAGAVAAEWRRMVRLYVAERLAMVARADANCRKS